MQQRSRLVTATAVPWPFYETRKSCLEKVLFQAFFNFCKGQLHLCRSPEWKKYQDVGRKGLFTHRLFHKRAKAFWRIIYQIFNEEAALLRKLVVSLMFDERQVQRRKMFLVLLCRTGIESSIPRLTNGITFSLADKDKVLTLQVSRVHSSLSLNFVTFVTAQLIFRFWALITFFSHLKNF